MREGFVNSTLKLQYGSSRRDADATRMFLGKAEAK